MPHPVTAAAQPAGVRLDKWLWAARFYRTRSLASAAIDAGHVQVGDQRAKPSRLVRVGERIRLTQPDRAIEIDVRALSDVRGAAPQAQALYAETEGSRARREAALRERQGAPLPGGPRPTKRDRRRIDDWADAGGGASR